MSICKACEDICSTCFWNGELSCGYQDKITVAGCPGHFKVPFSDDDIDRYIAEGYKYCEIVNNKIIGLGISRDTVARNKRCENSRIITLKQRIKENENNNKPR